MIIAQEINTTTRIYLQKLLQKFVHEIITKFLQEFLEDFYRNFVTNESMKFPEESSINVFGDFSSNSLKDYSFRFLSKISSISSKDYSDKNFKGSCRNTSWYFARRLSGVGVTSRNSFRVFSTNRKVPEIRSRNYPSWTPPEISTEYFLKFYSNLIHKLKGTQSYLNGFSFTVIISRTIP